MAAGAGAYFYLPNLSGGLSIDDPRSALEPPALDFPVAPSVVRFVSRSAHDTACFGLVTKARGGVPAEVFNLTLFRRSLGSSLQTFTAGGGFRIAGYFHRFGTPSEDAHLLETIAPEELAERILPPVDISARQLAAAERYIVGVGFNYQLHKEETASGVDKFAFAKPVVPSGAYRPLMMNAERQPLIDYEAEIGFVLLADFDLSQPVDPDRFWSNVAFFTANDISDRQPIVLQGQRGFTRGKTGRGFLPVGPWLVHGWHLRPRAPETADMALRLWLRVAEHGSARAMVRQYANARQMVRGPRELLAMIAQIHDRSTRSDIEGRSWEIARRDADGVSLPFGSIVLTGTPRGTAIEGPTLLDRLRLIARGHFSLSRARAMFVDHLVHHRRQMGYLSDGDWVETGVEVLGVQHWQVCWDVCPLP